MPIYALALDDYVKTDLLGKIHIIDDRIRNKDFRKKLIRDSILEEIIEATEKCVADKRRTIKDTNTKMYREMPYEDYGWCDYKRDARLTGIVYYNKTIKDIYHLKHLEFIKRYRQEMSISLMKLIYPAKMPREDYFPFADFDLGTEIPLLLTEEEKKRWNNDGGGLEIMSRVEVSDSDWNYGIFWIDSHRVFMNLVSEAYYFKQIGKDAYLFELSYE